MGAIMSGDATPAQIGALLVGLTMKGERPAEIVGLARTMRANAVQLSRTFDDVFDTCGTGGDRSGTFNISSAAALVAAGGRVARGEARQPIGLEPVRQRGCVRGAGRQCGRGAGSRRAIARRASASRSSLRRRFIRRCGTPLRSGASSPCAPRSICWDRSRTRQARKRQLVGVPHSELTELIARALLMLGSDRAWVVHGADGIDEMSTTGHTKVSECRNGAVSTFYVHPSDFGIPKAERKDLQGGDAAANAAILREVLAGRARAPARRRAAQCRRIAVRRRKSGVGARRNRARRAGHRFRRRPHEARRDDASSRLIEAAREGGVA